MDNEMYHHGILGQHWGIRRFQNKDGSLTNAGRERYSENDEYRDVSAGEAATIGAVGGTTVGALGMHAVDKLWYTTVSKIKTAAIISVGVAAVAGTGYLAYKVGKSVGNSQNSTGNNINANETTNKSDNKFERPDISNYDTKTAKREGVYLKNINKAENTYVKKNASIDRKIESLEKQKEKLDNPGFLYRRKYNSSSSSKKAVMDNAYIQKKLATEKAIEKAKDDKNKLLYSYATKSSDNKRKLKKMGKTGVNSRYV